MSRPTALFQVSQNKCPRNVLRDPKTTKKCPGNMCLICSGPSDYFSDICVLVQTSIEVVFYIFVYI